MAQKEFWVEIGAKIRMDFDAAVSRAKQGLMAIGTVAQKALGATLNNIGLGQITNLGSVFSSGLDKAEKYDKQISKLAASLKAAGEGGRTEAAALGEFASRLASSSGNSSEAVLQSIQLAKSSGVAADQLRKVAEASTAVANASGSDLGTATSAVTALLNGEAGAIQGLIPEFRHYSDATTILAKLNEQKRAWNAAGGQKQGGLSDEMNKMREAADGAFRSIGNAMLPAVKAVGKAIQELGPIITTVAGIVGEVLAKIAQLFAAVIKVSDKAGEAAGKLLFGDSKRVSGSKYQAEADARVKASRAAMTEEQKAYEAKYDAMAAQLAQQDKADEAAAAAAAKTQQIQKAQEAVNKEKQKSNDLQMNANALLHAEFSTASDLYKQTALKVLQTSAAGTATASGAAKTIAGQTAARDPALEQIAASTKATADAVTAMAQTQAADSAHWNR